MEKIDFLAGDESKFKEFVDGITSKDKIALISHTDHDGIAAAKIVSKVLNYSLLKFVDYEDINNSLIDELKQRNITKVVFTDLSINDHTCISNLGKFADVLIIDHHLFNEDMNSEKIVFMNVREYCATYLAYYLFSQIKKIEELDWLVASASIADWTYFKNTEFMTEVFKKYGEEFNKDKIKKGRFWEIQLDIVYAAIYFHNDLKKVFDSLGTNFRDIGDLKKHSIEIQKYIDEALKKFESEKEVYGDIYLWEINSEFPIKSVVTSILSAKEEDKTYLILYRDNSYYHISARRQDKRVNLPEFLGKLLKEFKESDFGGHIPAAGGHFLVSDLPNFKKRLEELA